MDGMLSQDEINALLNGIDTGTIDINDLQADSAPASSAQDGSFEPAAAVDSLRAPVIVPDDFNVPVLSVPS